MPLSSRTRLPADKAGKPKTASKSRRYIIIETMPKVVHGSYGALLWDERWREKRKRILARDNYRCVICGSTDELTVHHKQYHVTPDGKKYVPWNYDDRYLITLCKHCHQSGHSRYTVPIKTIYQSK